MDRQPSPPGHWWIRRDLRREESVELPDALLLAQVAALHASGAGRSVGENLKAATDG